MKNLFFLIVYFTLKTSTLFAYDPIPDPSSLDAKEINKTNCADLLNKEAQSVADFSLLKFQKTADLSEKNLIETINTSFLSRLKLQENFKSLHQIHPTLPKECISAFLKLKNNLREFEDRLQYLLNRALKNKNKESKIAFHGDYPFLLSNPKFGAFKYKESFKSGDIIISRGNTFISAAIARGNGSNNHFSHLSLVYIDEATSKIYTIESHIETGVVVRPIEDHIAQKNSREAIYRYPDAETAHRAAKYMYDLARKHKEPDNIPYDFAREMDEHSAIDCTEIVRLAFKAVTKNEVLFPKYISKFPDNLKNFLNHIGVTSTIGFLPGDIEVDPRVELVAEWRDAEMIEDTKYKNEIITTMYRWIGEKGYTYREDMTIIFMKNLGWHLRHWPFYMLEDKFPLTMTKKFIGAGLAVDLIGEVLFEELNFKVKQKNLASIFLLQNEEISKSLEQIRKVDLKNYQEHIPGHYANKLRVWPFHAYFRPNDVARFENR